MGGGVGVAAGGCGHPWHQLASFGLRLGLPLTKARGRLREHGPDRPQSRVCGSDPAAARTHGLVSR